MTWREAFAGLWRLQRLLWTCRLHRVKLALLRAQAYLCS